jgi:hypothetical protein
MPDSISKPPASHRWYWLTALLALLVAGGIWLGALWEPVSKIPVAAQPVAKATDWAVQPAGPAVPVTLPKTPMTNTPDKTP